MKNTRIMFALGCAAAVTAAGCERTTLEAPAGLPPAAIALTLDFPAELATSASALSAYLKSDRLSLRLAEGAATRQQGDVAFRSSDPETRFPLEVRLRQPRETLNFDLEVRRGTAAVFRAGGPVQLRTGRTTTIIAQLQPVIAAVRGPDAVAFSSWGDSLRLPAAVLFVTGDTLTSEGVSWNSLDPAIATVDSSGLAIARGDGDARLIVRAGQFADTVIARILAQAFAITVSPSSANIPVGSTQQYTAVVTDRRGNRINRPVTWSTSDPSILTVNNNGLALAVGVGSARVIASIQPLSGEVPANARPAAPRIESFKATPSGQNGANLSANIFPNGDATQSWFEWGPAGPTGLPPAGTLTTRQLLGSGLAAVPVNVSLQSLLPNTRYVVRVVAMNNVGITQSDTLSFVTPALLPAAATLFASAVSAGGATLSGTVNPNGSSTEVWFEWGTDPTLQTFQMTTLQTVSGFSVATLQAIIALSGPSTTIYFRIVARNQAGTVRGAIMSFNSTPPPPPGTPPPVAVTDTATRTSPLVYNLTGSVNPKGVTTMAWFEWSTDSTFATFTATPAQSVGAGMALVPYAAAVTGFPFEVPLYMRAVASSAGGVSRGAVVRFR